MSFGVRKPHQKIPNRLSGLRYERLLSLIRGLRRDARARNRCASKLYKTAGRDSNDNGGTGDEGWSKVFVLDGQAHGLIEAASRLERLISKQKRRKPCGSV